MDSIKNKAGNVFRSLAEKVIPVLKDSKFVEKGVLTPEEFVIAGDQLSYRCPTWSWEGGKENMRQKTLPPDQQFLITRNVPCTKRIKDILSVSDGAVEKELEDGWVTTEGPSAKTETVAKDLEEEAKKEEARRRVHGEVSVQRRD